MGGDVADFIGQIPPAFILTFCGFMTLLVVSLALLLANMGRNQNAKRRRTPPPPLQPAPAGNADLPDLDLLLGGAEATAAPGVGHAASSLPSPDTEPAANPAPAHAAEAAEVLTISHDLRDGSFEIRIGGRVYGHVAEIRDPEARRQLTGALKRLAEQVAKPPKPEPEPPPAEVSVPTPASPASRDDESAATVPAEEWDLPKFQELANEPLKLRGGRPKNAVPEINLAGAVEAYLQHKLRSTPEFAHRSLHIRPAPDGGVQIEVDGRFYEAVGDIEDERTRQFIASAIAEWQARQ